METVFTLNFKDGRNIPLKLHIYVANTTQNPVYTYKYVVYHRILSEWKHKESVFKYIQTTFPLIVDENHKVW